MLIFPLIVERILDVSIGLADTVMIASEGEAAVSGIALVDTVNNLFIALFSALATGGAVVVAHYIGQKNENKAAEASRQLFSVVAFLALCFMTIFLVSTRQILSMIFGSLEQDVMANAQVYFTLTVISYPFLAIYHAGAALFRARGNSRISMNVSLGMMLANILGNALLIYIAGWGVFGAGIATLFSRILAAVLIGVYLPKHAGQLQLIELFHIHLDWEMIRRILRIGIPSGVENSVFHIGKILVQSLTASFGTTAIAANAIANTISSITNIPGSAIGLATITVIGQCMGAGEQAQACRYTKKLLGIAYAILSVTATLLFLFITPLVGLFHLGPEVSQLAIRILRLLLLVNALIWPLAFTLPQALRASGDVRFTMVVSILSMWIFRIGFSYILAKGLGMGLMGIWIAMYIDWACRAICFVWRFLAGSWKEKPVI